MPRHRSATTKTTPKLTLEVTERQFDTFKKHLPYGFQKQVFAAIVEDMCQMWELFGDDFTRAMITKNLSYRQFMSEYIGRTYGNTPESKKEPFPITWLGRTERTYQRDPIPPKGEKKGEPQAQQDGQSDPSALAGGDSPIEEHC